MRALVLLLGLNAASYALSPAEVTKAKEVAREYVKDHLKAPATAVFSKETLCASLGKPDFEEAKGTGPTPECTTTLTATKIGNGAINVVYRGSVDSQNSYGALIRTKFQLDVFFKDGKVSIHDSADSIRLLKTTCLQTNETTRELNLKRPTMDCDAEYPSVK